MGDLSTCFCCAELTPSVFTAYRGSATVGVFYCFIEGLSDVDVAWRIDEERLVTLKDYRGISEIDCTEKNNSRICSSLSIAARPENNNTVILCRAFGEFLNGTLDFAESHAKFFVQG